MNRRWMIGSLLMLSGLCSIGCDDRTRSGGTTTKPELTPTLLAPIEVGADLYKKTPVETTGAVLAPSADVVVPNAVVRLDTKQTIPALVDGQIEVIGRPLPPGTQFNKDDRSLVYESEDKEKSSPYIRLREGDRINRDSIVAALNDLEIRVQIEASQKVSEACLKAITEAKKASSKIQEQVRIMKTLANNVAPLELIQLEATLARYEENVAQSEKEKVKAEGDEKRALAQRIKHRSNSKVNGIITKLMREPGEYVKAGEPIMEVLSTEDVRVEGLLEAQNAESVRPGMKVVVETSSAVGPDIKFGDYNHRREVTGIAVTAHKGRPMIVSSSLDNTVVIWDAFAPAGTQRTAYRLEHAQQVQGVRSIAVTGEAVAKHLLATGGEDGKIRLWDISNPEKISEKPLKELDESHASGVSTLTFSPDGKYLASASGREVILWSVADGKKMYAFQGEHHDVVTSLAFTPQSTLVTASRDKTLRVWKLGDKGATVERRIDHRRGNVDQLGISSKGGRALFDQEDGRIDVISLANGLPLGSLQTGGTAARFGTLAIFSPDDSHVLTAGGDGDLKGELILWTTPTAGGRGSDRKRLVIPGRATTTSAAFGTEGNSHFVVAGTRTGSVHVWTSSVLLQKTKERTGRVTAVIPNDSRTVRVTVVTDPSPDSGSVLTDKSAATIIVKSGEAAAPAAPGNGPTALVPMPNNNPMNVVVPAGGVPPVTNLTTVGSSAPISPVILPNVPMPERK